MIQHRKEGQRFFQGIGKAISEKVACGCGRLGFSFWETLISLIIERLKNSLPFLHDIAIKHREIYAGCLTKWEPLYKE
jgi:hypothetical protein